MKRRDLLSCLPIAAAMIATAAADTKAQTPAGNMPDNRQYLELRKYGFSSRGHAARFHSFLEKAAIPALNRHGITTVGVFDVKYGENIPSKAIYTLLPFNSLEQWSTMKFQLAADQEFAAAGADVLDAGIDNPAYLRVESSLMHAFKDIPQVVVPPQKKEGKSRIFELRIYESHSVKAALQKIHMFNEGGEIQIFRDTGLNPVFFGETLAGTQMPNLKYLLCHDNLEERDNAWQRFSDHPDWNKLKEMERYKDTVSNVTDIILSPASYSQL